MELVVDDLHTGTGEKTWLEASRFDALRPLGQRRPGRLVVVAPHPDDEILGTGGLLQHMDRVGVETLILAVTDGEASHPGARDLGCDLAAARSIETQIALDRLGCGSAEVQRLRLADGAVGKHLQDLTDVLSRLLGPDDLCLSPWRSDGHPDHNASGHAAVAAARLTRTPVLEYLVWTWHWATPETAVVPWRQCRRLDLERRQVARKRWATYAFTSQIRPLGSDYDGKPLLGDSVLRRFWRPFEVFIEANV